MSGRNTVRAVAEALQPNDVGSAASQDISAFATAAQGTLASASVNSSTALTTSVFDKQANIFNADDVGATDAAIVSRLTSLGTHLNAKSGFHVELISDGSGLAAGPQRADMTGSLSIFKKDFPLDTAADGELDTLQLAFRQVNGDASCILGNGVIHNGFGAFYEATNYSYSPVNPYPFTHGVNVQTCVVNDRDGSYLGYRANKLVGDGGTAIWSNQESGASWDFALSLEKEGIPQFRQDPADGSVLIYELGSSTEYVRLQSTNNELYVYNPAGVEVGVRAPSQVSYTPTITAQAGSLTAYTISSAKYAKSGKKVDVEVTFTVDTVGTATQGLTVTLPTTPDGLYHTGGGVNLTTGVTISSYSNGSSTFGIKSYDGTFPAVDGHLLSVSFYYYEA